jgi:hypothetical protein
MHDRAAAVQLDSEIREYLDKLGIKYTEAPTDRLTPWRIVNAVRPDIVKTDDFPLSLLGI